MAAARRYEEQPTYLQDLFAAVRRKQLDATLWQFRFKETTAEPTAAPEPIVKKYVSESDLTHDELNAALNEESDLQFWRADIHGVLWFKRGGPMIRGVPKPVDDSVEGECEFTTDDDDEFEDDE